MLLVFILSLNIEWAFNPNGWIRNSTSGLTSEPAIVSVQSLLKSFWGTGSYPNP